MSNTSSESNSGSFERGLPVPLLSQEIQKIDNATSHVETAMAAMGNGFPLPVTGRSSTPVDFRAGINDTAAVLSVVE